MLSKHRCSTCPTHKAKQQLVWHMYFSTPQLQVTWACLWSSSPIFRCYYPVFHPLAQGTTSAGAGKAGGVHLGLQGVGQGNLQRHVINTYRKRNKHISTIMLWIRCPIHPVKELNYLASQAPPVDCFIWCIKSWRCWMSSSTLADSSVMLKQHMPLKSKQRL